ncbi:MAG: hypothetical protein ACO2OX_04490 [Candidatus Nanopusillus sp.]
MRLVDFYNNFISEIQKGNRNIIYQYNAHGLVYLSIIEKGYKEKNGIKIYNAFKDEIFGLDYFLDRIVRFIYSAANGQDTFKRILILIGPPGSSKSSIVSILKVLLEEYTKNHEIYAPKDCPNRCNPLFLLPRNLKEELKYKYGVNYLEPFYLPCPVCQKTLRENSWEEIELVPIQFSRLGNIGISTYAPGDPNSTDDSVLIGNFSIAKLSIYKNDSDPRVWNYTGALQSGNRGIVEFVEIMKSKTEHLNILLTASQDKMIVLKNFGAYNIDTFLISHTNIPEYQNFIQRSDTEAFRDRLFVIKIPYNLSYSSEIKIIKKLVKEINHMDPLVYKVSAYFSILTRIIKSYKKEDLEKIIQIFDEENENVNNNSDSSDIESIKKEYYEDFKVGMSGVSPRTIANILSELSSFDEVSCIDVLKKIYDNFIKFNQNKNVEYNECYSMTEKFLENEITKTVIDALLGYDEIDKEIDLLFRKYYDHLGAYVNKTELKDPVTGKKIEIDETFLSSIDKHLKIVSDYEHRKNVYFRLLSLTSSLLLQNQTLSLKKHLPEFYNALKEYMFKEKIKLFAPSLNFDIPISDESKNIIRIIIENMKKIGFSEKTAKIVLKYMNDNIIKFA